MHALKTFSAIAVATALSGTAHAVAVAGPTFYGPTPYLQESDSPFTGTAFTYFHRETFESGALSTPGVTASAGFATAPSTFSDSVDADDGAIDGFGTAGRAWYSGNVASSMSFTFSSTVLGTLPTHAGIVWTDVGNVLAGSNFSGGVTFEAFDANGTSLGSIGPSTLGELGATGETAEDRFFGVYNPGGVSRITISMNNSVDWEVDHLQYGSTPPIPEPETYALMLAGLGLVGWAARRRMR
jgi:hypothetical protein